MKRKIFIGFILGSLIFGLLSAKEFKVAVVQLPSSEMNSNFIKALLAETDNTAIIEIVPKARAFYMIENRQTDIVFPSTDVHDPKKPLDLKFDYSSATLYKVCFILCTNKNKNITADELKAGNPSD
jgi:hypothetical protein